VNGTDSISILNGSEITASTFSSGNAGDVAVDTESLFIDRMDSQFSTGISSQANGNSSGDGGSVEVSAPLMQIDRGGRISVASFGTGQGGIANIESDLLMVFGREFQGFTGIQSETSLATAGGINVNAASVVLNNGQVVSSTFDRVSDGGDISLSSRVVVMDSGYVQANADSGMGGAINIDTEALLADGNSVQIGGAQRAVPQFDGPNIVQAVAPNGVNGFVAINAPELDTAALVSSLDSNFFSAKSLAQNPCDAFSSGSQSSLVELSLGGLPLSLEPSNAVYSMDNLRQGERAKLSVSGGKERQKLANQPRINEPEVINPAPRYAKVKYQWSLLRSAQSLEGEILASLRNGTRVMLGKKIESWYRVTVEENNELLEGYMHQSVLEVEGSSVHQSQPSLPASAQTAKLQKRHGRFGCRIG